MLAANPLLWSSPSVSYCLVEGESPSTTTTTTMCYYNNCSPHYKWEKMRRLPAPTTTWVDSYISITWISNA